VCSKVTAAAVAASLGFVGASWKTLDTGCELDWHFVGPATVKIGLNNYVYTLTKHCSSVTASAAIPTRAPPVPVSPPITSDTTHGPAE